MSQKVPVDDFKWVEETYEFNKDFIERYTSESDKRYFLEVDDQYPEKNITFTIIYLFYLKQ